MPPFLLTSHGRYFIFYCFSTFVCNTVCVCVCVCLRKSTIRLQLFSLLDSSIIDFLAESISHLKMLVHRVSGLKTTKLAVLTDRFACARQSYLYPAQEQPNNATGKVVPSPAARPHVFVFKNLRIKNTQNRTLKASQFNCISIINIWQQ